MSKAANHQALKREDFMKVTVSDKKNAFQAPALPTLDGTEDEDEVEDIIKLQPVNIAMLKELMQRKVQKLGPTGLQGKRVNQLMAHMGLNSRETSMRSLHSTGSKNSKKSNTSYRK